MAILNTMKKRSLKTAAAAALALLALAAVPLALDGHKAFRLVGGPKDLTALSHDEWNGAYITYDYPLENGLSMYMWTSEVDDSGIRERIISYDFMMLAPGGTQWLGLRVPVAEDMQLGQAYEDLWQAHEAGEYDPAQPPAFTFTGTLEALEGNALQYFYELADEYGLARAQTLPYVLTHARVHGSAPGRVWLLFAAACALAAAALALVLLALSGVFQRGLRRFCAEQDIADDIAREKFEASFEQGAAFGGAFFGTQAVVYQSGLRTRALPVRDIVWAYQKPGGKGPGHNAHLVLGTRAGQLREITLSQLACAQALKFMKDSYPNVALGYFAEIERQFRQDPTALLPVAAEQRRRKPAEERGGD